MVGSRAAFGLRLLLIIGPQLSPVYSLQKCMISYFNRIVNKTIGSSAELSLLTWNLIIILSNISTM